MFGRSQAYIISYKSLNIQPIMPGAIPSSSTPAVSSFYPAYFASFFSTRGQAVWSQVELIHSIFLYI